MAKEYIDRVGLIAELDCRVDDLRAMYGDYDHYTDGYDDCSEVVSNYPIVADVVEVVRCNNCKHCDPENGHCDHTLSTSLPVSRKPDDYCSYGERRENA